LYNYLGYLNLVVVIPKLFFCKGNYLMILMDWKKARYNSMRIASI